ncbi:MAG: flagellar hook-associated protein FlgK [Ruminiclostridium sp.]|nr:flagellar hook-associated protein FlgK [Ruminiclostridium sp.]
MSGSFFGLNVAVRGLFTAQKSLDTVNHNLNNVNTPGFSRQRPVQTAARPMALNDGTGMLGTGSDVISVERVRDEYLDFKYWSENITMGEWQAKSEVLDDMEVTFNEPSNSGFTVILSDFYNSLQELGKDPGSTAVRALVKQKGITVAKYFNSVASHFEKLQEDVNYRIKTKVEEVNSFATQIQQLSRQIYIAELDGNAANDLRDQRTLLVDKISKIINVEANEVVAGKLPSGKDDKHFTLTISGKSLIDHFDVSKLAVVQRSAAQKVNAEDVSNLYEVQWADGNSLNVKGGQLRGYLDARDGNEGQTGPNGIIAPLYKGIPYYQKKMNEFVRTFAMAFNEGFIDADGDGTIPAGEDMAGHADAFGLTGSTGTRFFTNTGVNGQEVDSATFLGGAVTTADIYARYANITAKNFSVSSDIMTDYNTIAVSDAAGEVGNINVLNSILDMRHNPDMFAEGAPEDYMKSLVATMGIDNQQAQRYEANQNVIVKQIENRRLSDSGVSMDEEMASMVKFQHAYNASAKMIQTMSEIYDTLINKLFV